MLNLIFISLIGGLASVLVSGLLFTKLKTTKKFIGYITAFAAGGLIAAAAGDLLTEAVHHVLDGQLIGKSESPDIIGLGVLLGIVIFFVLESVMHFFHHHHDHEHAVDKRATTSLIITGDTLHNFFDGLAIGASFLVSKEAAIVTALAVALHEIPQEIGDFGMLLSKGYSKTRALVVNILSSFSTIAGAILVYKLGDDILPVPLLLSITAGFFLYIALSDIIPSIHETTSRREKQLKSILLLTGILVVGISIRIAHGFIEA
jgi:zinc and cadmium transporter